MMIVASRFLASALLMLSMASGIAASAATAGDCSDIATSAGSTSDCCNCICGHDKCAVFKRVGESLTCDADRVHCYNPEDFLDDGDDVVPQQEQGEWVLQDNDADATTIVGNPEAKILSPHLLQCRQTPIMPGHTDECCSCACSTSSCAVFKTFGEELVCDPLKIHCYDDDDDDEDDKETFDDAEGEWIETIREEEQAELFAKCLDVDIPSASETESCCQCACGSTECAIFKTAGEELTCNASNIHCYEPSSDGESDDDDDAKQSECIDVAIADDTNTEDCCECLCGHSLCSVFKVPGEPLTCEASKVHCFDESSYNNDSDDTKKQEAESIATSDGAEGSTSPILADCSAVDVSLDDTRSCCNCACGHHDCAIFHSAGSGLTCDKLKIHCYSQEGEDDDDASAGWMQDADENILEEGSSPGTSKVVGITVLSAAAVTTLAFIMG